MIVSEMRSTMDDAIVTGATSYSDGEKDRAFRFAANEFIRLTKCTRTSDTIATVSGTKVYDFTGEASDFKAFRFIRAEIDFDQLEKVAYSAIARDYAKSSESGEPTRLAFVTDTEMYVHPSPDAAYTITIWYYQPLTITYSGTAQTWTMGSANASITGATINIADEYIDGVIRWGAIPALVASAPGVLLRNGEWNRFYDFIEDVKGAVDPDDGVWTPDEADFIA